MIHSENMKWNKEQIIDFKTKALHWASQFDVCMLLDNNFIENACSYQNVELMVAAGINRDVKCDVGNAFENLKKFHADTNNDKFILGSLSYDLKNEIENLHSVHSKGINFPELYFFEPQHFLLITKDGNVIGDENLILQIQNFAINKYTGTQPLIPMHPKVSRDKYIDNVEKIKQHIVEGDIYEMNYCVEFFNEHAEINPAIIYEKLKLKSPTPFGVFYKCNDQYLICASPERFIKKEGSKLISQPIKGTIKRGQNLEEDELMKQELLHSEKECAENLMIVDLVRNDLARSSQTGTVDVEELFGIYSFKQVHQMISTVTSTMKDDMNIIEAIKNAFPMGSMTGAPKIMSMELIEQYETTKRGLYSGAVGYISGNDDFDFNVVIRSIQYNAATNYLCYEVGSAITYDSIAAQEYDECILKAQAILAVLGNIE